MSHVLRRLVSKISPRVCPFAGGPIENRPAEHRPCLLEHTRCLGYRNSANSRGRSRGRSGNNEEQGKRDLDSIKSIWKTPVHSMTWSDVEPEQMKSVRVAIVGPPNAGKSTLLNSLMQQEVSAMSRYTQTTEGLVKGVITEEDTQVVFVDTPGMMYSEWKYSKKSWVRATYHDYHGKISDTILGTDVVVYMMDGSLSAHNLYLWRDFSELFSKVPELPVILLLNKADIKQEQDKMEQVLHQLTAPLPTLDLPTIATRTDIPPPPITYHQKFADGFGFKNMMSVSALQGTNLEYLWYAIKECAVARPWEYTPDTVSPDSMQDIVTNLVRAELLAKLGSKKGYRIGHSYIGHQEDHEAQHLLIEHALFFDSQIFDSPEDFQETVSVLEKKLTSRFGVKVSLGLKMRYHTTKDAMKRFMGEVEEIEIIEDEE